MIIYYSVREIARFTLKIFAKKIELLDLHNIPKEGPVLFASTHSNSFLDAIVLCCTFDKPVWSLARGDAFKNPKINWLLRKFAMLPIFRISEGKVNMTKNQDTFNEVLELHKKNQHVLIFSEGLCSHQTQLIPLKKGTARMAKDTWQAGIPLQVVPIGITYNSFSGYGKEIRVQVGKPMYREDFDLNHTEISYITSFNTRLTEELKRIGFQKLSPFRVLENPLYYVFRIINFPVIRLASFFLYKKLRKTVFYDSVMYASTLILTPIWLGILIGVGYLIWG
ncbi:MAG: 1-acyl-sn-glycerol-3-phosphate acyltransferase [Leadbetterella sp.]